MAKQGATNLNILHSHSKISYTTVSQVFLSCRSFNHRRTQGNYSIVNKRAYTELIGIGPEIMRNHQLIKHQLITATVLPRATHPPKLHSL
jgi:hypothetical protein